MKAIVYTHYGTPAELRLAEVPIPVPKADEVLVKVRAVSLNRSDWEGLIGKPLYARSGGLFRPRRTILGSDIAGEVVAVGRDVSGFRIGEDVFADILERMGGFAEYVCVPEKALALMPRGMTYAEASCLPQAGAIAWQGICDKGKVQLGQQVLINGAGGGSGMYAIQLAKLRGAAVTAVDNAEKLDFMRTLGADSVMDYAQEDFTRAGRTYDLILDLVAYRSVHAYSRALAPGGQYMYVGGSVSTLLKVVTLGPLVGRSAGKKIKLLIVQLGTPRLDPLVELCRNGKITSFIDREYSLAEVPEALQYLGEGHAKGKVVVLVD